MDYTTPGIDTETWRQLITIKLQQFENNYLNTLKDMNNLHCSVADLAAVEAKLEKNMNKVIEQLAEKTKTIEAKNQTIKKITKISKK